MCNLKLYKINCSNYWSVRIEETANEYFQKSSLWFRCRFIRSSLLYRDSSEWDNVEIARIHDFDLTKWAIESPIFTWKKIV